MYANICKSVSRNQYFPNYQCTVYQKNHAGIKDPLKLQDTSMNFKITEQEIFIDMVSNFSW